MRNLRSRYQDRTFTRALLYERSLVSTSHEREYLPRLERMIHDILGRTSPTAADREPVRVMKHPSAHIVRSTALFWRKTPPSPATITLQGIPFKGCLSAGVEQEMVNGDPHRYPAVEIPDGYLALHPTLGEVMLVRPWTRHEWHGAYQAVSPGNYLNQLIGVASKVTSERAVREDDLWFVLSRLLPRYDERRKTYSEWTALIDSARKRSARNRSPSRKHRSSK